MQRTSMSATQTKLKWPSDAGIQLGLPNPDRSCASKPGSGPAVKQKSAEEINDNNNRAANVRIFAVKKHRASRLHYDFRLGWNGVLLSWAVPQGPSYCPDLSREAIEVADHDIDNIAFEGVLPEGRPGAGPIMQWDIGVWEPQEGYSDIEDCLRKGCLKITLHGEKLKGNWKISRRVGSCGNRREPVWDLIKEADSFARSKDVPSILGEKPNSITTGRTLEEIERDWNEGKDKVEPEADLFGIWT